MVTQMISVGEKTGGLDEMLGKIAGFYDEEVDAAVAALTSIIEPVIIVIMGTVIGGILQISRTESRAGLPWLSRIPVLGYLFRKDTNSTRNRELLIFITPKILKQEPVQAKAS